MAQRRTTTELGLIWQGEIDGREPVGTVARMMSEMTGKKPLAPPDEGSVLGHLEKQAELLSSPAAVKKHLADLKHETKTAHDASAKAAQDRREADEYVAHTRKTMADEQAAWSTRQATEIVAHQTKIRDGEKALAEKQREFAAEREEHARQHAAARAKAEEVRRQLSEVGSQL